MNARDNGCNDKHDVHLTCDKNIVYSIPMSCGGVYVGQSGQCVNTRLTQHSAKTKIAYFDESSTFWDHLDECTGCVPWFGHTDVLGHHATRAGREILEAAYIENTPTAVSMPSIHLHGAEREFLNL